MITYTQKQGDKNEIKIEIPESVEDAQKNGFAEGQSSRIFINGKKTDNHLAMMHFMIDEIKKNGQMFIPDDPKKLQSKILASQKEQLQQQIDKIKQQYKQMNVPDNVFDQFDEFTKKVSLEGLRVKA